MGTKYRYYIFMLANGDVMGANDESEIADLRHWDECVVLDTLTGLLLVGDDMQDVDRMQ